MSKHDGQDFYTNDEGDDHRNERSIYSPVFKLMHIIIYIPTPQMYNSGSAVFALGSITRKASFAHDQH